MIHLTNAPSRGARLLARKRRIPNRSSPATAVTTQSRESALNSTVEYDRASTTDITLPVNVSDSSTNPTTPHNDNLPGAQLPDNQRTTTNRCSDKPVLDGDPATDCVQPVTDASGPEPKSSNFSPSPSAVSEESSSIPAIRSPVKEMKILKLANAVEDNKPQGCFSSDGSRSVSPRASLSSDCRHQKVDTVEKIKLTLLSTVSLNRPPSHAPSAPAAEAGSPVLHMGSNLTAIANGRSAFGGGSLHGGVNVLLGGAMLSGLILLVFFICYCCQRSARKHEQNCRSQYWIQDPEARLEVFTLDGQRIDRTAGLLVGADALDVGAFLHTNNPSPPPPYEAVVCKSAEGEGGDLPLTGVCDFCDELVPDGLPTYEAALRLEADRKP